MQLLREPGPAVVQFDADEVHILRKILDVVLDEANIYDQEFQTRIGWERAEVAAVAESLPAIDAAEPVQLPASSDLVGILAESAKEALYGIHVDFADVVGDVEMATALHAALKQTYRALESQ